MLDTRTCCAGDIPETTKRIQNLNYRLKLSNSILVATLIIIIAISATRITIMTKSRDRNLKPII